MRKKRSHPPWSEGFDVPHRAHRRATRLRCPAGEHAGAVRTAGLADRRGPNPRPQAEPPIWSAVAGARARCWPDDGGRRRRRSRMIKAAGSASAFRAKPIGHGRGRGLDSHAISPHAYLQGYTRAEFGLRVANAQGRGCKLPGGPSTIRAQSRKAETMSHDARPSISVRLAPCRRAAAR